MIVIITGLPGTGKTTFAEALAAQLQAVYLGSDKMRILLGKSGQYDDSAKEAIYAAMLDEMQHSMAHHKDVVIDGTFYKKGLRTAFAELAARHEADVNWIEITADPAVIRERMQQPRRYSEADYLIFEKIQAHYEPLEVRHLTLRSDRLPLDVMLNLTNEYLGNAASPADDNEPITGNA